MDKPTTLGAGWREIGLVALALAALTALTLFLTDGVVLFTRPLWLDEWLTVVIARRPTPAWVIADLAAGADGGSGLFHLVMWGLGVVAGDLGPALLRAVSLAAVLGALCFVYATLRFRFSVGASLGGTLAVGANAVVVAQAFDARFYGPWLLCAAAHAWSLSRAQEHASRGRRATQGVTAALLALAHFYGVVSLSLMVAAVFARHWRGGGRRDALRLVAPSLAGFAALAAIVPLAVSMQRAFTVPSWIPTFIGTQLLEQARLFWIAGVPVLGGVAIAAAVVAGLLRRGSRPIAATAADASSDAGILALAALALTPLAFAVLSFLARPAMLPRYSVAAALAWAPWVAVALEHWGRHAARMAYVVVAWFWIVAYTREVRSQRLRAEEVAGLRAALAHATRMRLPVASPSMHVLMPLLTEPAVHAVRYLEPPDSVMRATFPPGSAAEWRGRFMLSERDLARVHARRFGFPRLVTAQSLDSLPVFLLLAPARTLSPGFLNMEHFAAALFPARRTTMLRSDLAILERRVSASP